MTQSTGTSSSTTTTTLTQENQSESTGQAPVGSLLLSGSRLSPSQQRRVMWEESVVDNEHLGRKSSKSKTTLLILIWITSTELISING